MLDIHFIRENQKLVTEAAQAKQITVDLKRLLKLDEQRRQLTQTVDELRRERNRLAGDRTAKPDKKVVQKGKALKEELEQAQAELKQVQAEWDELMLTVPNVIPADTPAGGEADARVEREWGRPAEPGFKPREHLDLASAHDWLDFERGAKVAGTKHYYLRGELAELKWALMQWGLAELRAAGFTLLATPHLTNRAIYEGSGFQPRGAEEQSYSVADEDLVLIGTAEIPLAGYHQGEILEPGELPRLYAALTPAYRREAGAYGKHAKGLFRVHQFDKLEMFIFCTPEESAQWQGRLLEVEERLYQQLEIPYRVVRIAAGDLGAPAYTKYDLEYYSPVDGEYRELTSCSNCTDFQARRLGIRVRAEGGKVFAHTLNGTALADSRSLIAIIENHQTKSGQVKVPKVLQQYLGKKTIG